MGRETSSHHFDSSSVADLAFLLLIFFIVTSSFILRQGISFSLPSKTTGSEKVEDKLMFDIYPTNTGYKYEGAEISRKKLIRKLVYKKNRNTGTIVVIHMYPDIKYKRLVDTLSVAKECGITRVSLKDYKE